MVSYAWLLTSFKLLENNSLGQGFSNFPQVGKFEFLWEEFENALYLCISSK